MNILPMYKVILGSTGIMGISSVVIATTYSSYTFEKFEPKCRIFLVNYENSSKKFSSEITLKVLKDGDYGRDKKLIQTIQTACDNNIDRVVYLKRLGDWKLEYQENEQESLRKEHKR